MRAQVVRILNAWDLGAVIYLFAINTIYFSLTLVGFLEMLRHRFLAEEREFNAQHTGSTASIESSVLVQPVSILAPAYNEAATVCDSVQAMLSLRYPEFEVIVINDGSKDRTLELLIERFHL